MNSEKNKCDDLQCPHNKLGFCNKKQESPEELTVKIIAHECEAFYKVFLDIEAHILPFWENVKHGIFEEEALEEKTLYGIPYVVNGSFAAELAIKYLLETANIDYCQGNKGHDLRYLFDLLLLNKKSIKEDREAIISLLCSDGHQTLETLKQNISAWHDCYNRHRYLYSYGSAGTNQLFPKFVHAVCDYAISKAKLKEEAEE